MAGLVDKFKRMWDAPDDEYDEYDEYTYEDESEEDLNASGSSSSSSSDYSYQRESTSAPRRNKVVNINATAKLQVVLFKPERFGEETRAIADELIKMHTVVLNLENTNRDMSRRIIDF